MNDSYRAELKTNIAPHSEAEITTRIDLEALPPSALLTAKEASEVLSTPETTLNLWRHRRNVSIPYVKIGANVRYRAGDLLDYIKKQTVAA